MKRILTVQDISCVGKCSLSVALPIISALGVECAVLPTAVLSTHTAFKNFTIRDLGGDMNGIALLYPQWAARCLFGALLLANGLIFWKRVLPAYQRSFAHQR